jgi:hypothetical protein
MSTNDPVLDRLRAGLVLGIDPGTSQKKGSALAFLRADTGELVHAALVRVPKGEHWLGQLAALRRLSWQALTDQLDLPSGPPNARLRAVTVELPQVYDRRNTGERKIDPNDLVELGALAGAWAAAARGVCPDAMIDLVRPAVWKGQTPKDVVERQLRDQLTHAEITIVERAAPASLLDNVWDAVGIARWTWRLSQRRTV